MAESDEKSVSEQRQNEFREITSELWRIQDEMDNLKTHMWRALHRLGHALEEMDRDE